MLIIIDKKIPGEAKEKLAAQGPLLELETEGIVYPSISGHPDIFFCQTPQTLIISPDLPGIITDKLIDQKIPFILGDQTSGNELKTTVRYNAAVTDHYLVHRLEFTDPIILQHCHTLKKIPVKQGYTRCNLLFLRDDRYISSDHGIHKKLQRAGLEGILVSSKGILLTGFPNGFIGGAMGLLNDTIFIIGSLSYFPDGYILKKFLEDLNYRIVELYQGPLFDGGGILFMNYRPT